MKGSQASKRHERSTPHSSQQPKPVLGFPVLWVSYAQKPSLEIVSWALHGVLCLGERGSSGTTVLLTLRVSWLLSQISNTFLCSWLQSHDLILPHKTCLVFPTGKSHSFWVQLTMQSPMMWTQQVHSWILASSKACTPFPRSVECQQPHLFTQWIDLETDSDYFSQNHSVIFIFYLWFSCSVKHVHFYDCKICSFTYYMYLFSALKAGPKPVTQWQLLKVSPTSQMPFPGPGI